MEKEDKRISISRLINIATILQTSVSALIDEKDFKFISQINNEDLGGYVETIINANKEHVQTLKSEILFLRKLLEEKK